jgi:hypothetical protein
MARLCIVLVFSSERQREPEGRPSAIACCNTLLASSRASSRVVRKIVCQRQNHSGPILAKKTETVGDCKFDRRVGWGPAFCREELDEETGYSWTVQIDWNLGAGIVDNDAALSGESRAVLRAFLEKDSSRSSWEAVEKGGEYLCARACRRMPMVHAPSIGSGTERELSNGCGPHGWCCVWCSGFDWAAQNQHAIASRK